MHEIFINLSQNRIQKGKNSKMKGIKQFIFLIVTFYALNERTSGQETTTKQYTKIVSDGNGGTEILYYDEYSWSDSSVVSSQNASGSSASNSQSASGSSASGSQSVSQNSQATSSSSSSKTSDGKSETVSKTSNGRFFFIFSCRTLLYKKIF